VRSLWGWKSLAASMVAVVAAIPSPARGGPELDEYAARTLTRLALIDLRRAESPRPEDYAITAELLSIAHEFDPDDDAILRHWAEASFEAEDSDGVLRASKLLLRLDPRDDVSLLRLVSGQIAKLQTAEERIAAYDQAVEEERFDPSVRSRLALDAAMLKRERGDMGGFAALLSRAIELDSTNKDAAALAATWYADRMEDPIGRFDLLSNLLYADPIDPNVHGAIRDLLAREGAYGEAIRFHDNAVRIMTSVGDRPPRQMGPMRAVLSWQAFGPQDVVDELNTTLVSMRHRTEADMESMARGGQEPPSGFRMPDQTRLARDIDTIRLLAAESAGDTVTLTKAMDDLERSMLEATQALLRPEARPADVSVQQVGERLGLLQADLMSARLWVNLGVEHVAEQVESLTRAIEAAAGEEGGDVEVESFLETSAEIEAGGTEEAQAYRAQLEEFAAAGAKETLPTLQGWLSLRRGEPERAVELLSPMAENSAFARLGLALAHEASGERESALEVLRELTREYALSHVGAWAEDYAERIAEEGYQLHPNRTRMRAAAASVPKWIDRMAARPRESIRLTAQLTRPAAPVVERAEIRVQIRNLARVPLGFGPNRPIDSRLLVQPRADAGTRSLQQLLEPEVVDLGRQLRLMPGETLEAVIWPDPGGSGMLMESLATQQTRTRWRVMQGFTLNSQGQYQPGPAGLTAETDLFARPRLEATTVSLAELARRIRESGEDALPELIVSARARLPRPTQSGQGDAPPPQDTERNEFEVVMDALVERFQAGDVATRIVIVAAMPSRALVPMLAPLDEAIASAENLDPRTQAVVLLTRAAEAADPRFDTAQSSDDSRLSRLASLLRKRLEEGRPAYATIGRPRPAAPRSP